MNGKNDMRAKVYDQIDKSADELLAKIQKIRVRCNLAKMEVRDQHEKRLADVEAKFSELRHFVKTCRENAPDDWDETKSRLNAMWDEVKDGYTKVEDAFSGKESQSG